MHGNSAENILLHGRRKNAWHAQNSNQNQKGPDTIYMITIWYTFENCTVLAKLEGVPLGGRGLRCNLGSKGYTIRISHTYAEKIKFMVEMLSC